MNEQVTSREQWGSRIGYVLSTLGMAIGLGAMWRFPMLVARNGGGAFVLAFTLITMLIAVPAGWAEMALGKKAKSGAADAFSMIVSKKVGRPMGFVCSLVSLGLNMYYHIVIGYILYYLLQTIIGADYFSNSIGFFEGFTSSKISTLVWGLVAIVLTAVACIGGIKDGIEKICKVMLPALFIILVVLSIFLLTIPGVSEGIEYYVKPDFSVWKDPNLWITASGMALFAIGLGPAVLVSWGSYLDDDSDVVFDFLTVGVWNIVTCVLAGFVVIPALVAFNMEITQGEGLVFQVLPNVFSQMPATRLIALLYFIALLFAALSSSIGIMENTVTIWTDMFKKDRKTIVLIVTALTAIGLVVCNFVDYTVFDYFVGNVGYNITAAFIAVILAWKFGASKVREEWLNPTSRQFKIGKWYDVVFKFIICPTLIYFAVSSVIGFVQLIS